jgi:hypothetical protein
MMNTAAPRCSSKKMFILFLWYLPLLLPIIIVPQATPAEKKSFSDIIVVKEAKLFGNINKLDSDGIEFETIYGQGTIIIPYIDIESIKSLREFRFILESGEDVQCRILALKGTCLFVDDYQSEERCLKYDEIRTGVPEEEFNRSFWTRFRYRYPYWSGSLDMGLNFEKGGTDKKKIELGFVANRRRRPTRFLLNGRYAYEVQGTTDNPEVTTKDEFRIFLLGEYDIAASWFLFLLPAAEWDVPRGIELRMYPAAGIGYRLSETTNSLLQFMVGPAYVWEEFTVFGENDYTSLFLGCEGRYQFRTGISIGGHIYYYPDITGPGDNWLFRTELDLTIPLYGPLAMLVRFNEVYDNNPEPNVGNNKFTTLVGLAVKF